MSSDDPLVHRATMSRPSRADASPPHARRWPWAVAVATLVVFVLANVAYPSEIADPYWTGMFSMIVFAFVLVGALLTSRVPENAIGPLILGSGALLATTIAIGTLGTVAAQRGDAPVEVVAVAMVINDLGFQVPIIVILIGIPLIFPNGHLLSPRWRWVVGLAVAATVAVVFSSLVRPGPIGSAAVDNPFAVPALATLAEALDTIASLASILGFVAAVLAVVIRYRRGDEVQRHQLKWLIAIVTVATISFPIAFFVPDTLVGSAGFVLGLLAMLALPLAIAVAILRYRLYEIDRIISRTLAWAIISGILLTAFVALVVGLQAALDGLTQGDTLAVAASTLVAATLFQPVRRVVQRAVDRRFDRSRYDGQRTSDAFAERLRDEVDLDTLTAELEGIIAGAMRPSATTVWLAPRERATG